LPLALLTLAELVPSAPVVKRWAHWPPTSALPHPDALLVPNLSWTRTVAAPVGVGVSVLVGV
jgi:hypothetical protein